MITSVGLRVFPLPAAQRYEGWSAFRDFEAGGDALRRLAQAELAPDVARLSDEAETRMSLALAGNGGQGAARWARVLRGALRCCVCGWEGDARSRSRAAGARWRRRRCGGAGAMAAGRRRRARLGSPRRYAGPHLRDDLLDRGVLVETLETATTLVEPGARCGPR